ncbi:MAG: DUF1840 domain-containing protein [Rubrivivax sp.]
MIYRFKSRAAGDLLMLGPHGDALLRALGREPSARGIIEPASMPAAQAALQAAIEADEALRAARLQGNGAEAPTPQEDSAGPGEATARDGVSLRQRWWPMVEMLRRAQAAGEPVVWGV